jgi:hypothetical protein
MSSELTQVGEPGMFDRTFTHRVSSSESPRALGLFFQSLQVMVHPKFMFTKVLQPRLIGFDLRLHDLVSAGRSALSKALDSCE